jgi:hypothetical protein
MQVNTVITTKFIPYENKYFDVWFLASATKKIMTVLLWVITQRVMVICYRRFGTTYRSHLQGTRLLEISKIRCVTIQKNAVLKCTDALHHHLSEDKILWHWDWKPGSLRLTPRAMLHTERNYVCICRDLLTFNTISYLVRYRSTTR